jgi:hypothetical protein
VPRQDACTVEAARPSSQPSGVRAEPQPAAGAQDSIARPRAASGAVSTEAARSDRQVPRRSAPADPLRSRLSRATDDKRGGGDRRPCEDERDEAALAGGGPGSGAVPRAVRGRWPHGPTIFWVRRHYVDYLVLSVRRRRRKPYRKCGSGAVADEPRINCGSTRHLLAGDKRSSNSTYRRAFADQRYSS